MLRIYHTSDLHDHRGIRAPLDALRRAQPGLLFDCGDSLRGSQTVYHRDEPIIREMDEAGYDAQAMGNREFHYLYRCVRARAAQMRHPLLCSNLLDVKGRDLPFMRSMTLKSAGQTLRVLALLVMQYPPGSAWERIFGWRFLEPVDVVREFTRGIGNDEILVVLSHLGLRSDRKLAQAVPRIDLLLGGHSHDTLVQPEYVGRVPIVHAGPYGKFASRTLLERTPSGVQVHAFELVPLLP